MLLSRVLGLNETQESALGLMFHWADQAGVIRRELVELQNAGTGTFFGGPELDTADLIRPRRAAAASSAAWSWPACSGRPRSSRRS